MSTQRHFDVSDFGAAAGAGAVCTEAFQEAVNSCASSGGGTVFVPPGEYRVGRVILRSNVTLKLCAGAVIRPSRDKADYPPIANLPECNYRPENGENALNSRYAVFYALNAANVEICGPGVIDGEGEAFWTPKNTGPYEEWNMIAQWFYFTPNAFRPISLMFEGCQNVVVRDLTLINASCYSAWLAGCERMRFENVVMRNEHAGPNTDGLHFSSCRSIAITGCDFTCGDDCIAIDPNYGGVSENFTISDCRFDTSVNVFRIYTGLDPGLPPKIPRGEVRGVVASNCVVSNASGVFNVTAENGDIHGLLFTSFVIRTRYRGSAFFFIALKKGTIRRIALSHMVISTDGIGSIVGDGGVIERIDLDGLEYEVSPRTKLYGNGLPENLTNWGCHSFAPYGFFVRNAKDVTLSDSHLIWCEGDLSDLGKVPNGSPDWPAVECTNVRGMVLRNVLCSAHGAGYPDILLADSPDSVIQSCLRPDGSPVTIGTGHE